MECGYIEKYWYLCLIVLDNLSRVCYISCVSSDENLPVAKCPACHMMVGLITCSRVCLLFYDMSWY